MDIKLSSEQYLLLSAIASEKYLKNSNPQDKETFDYFLRQGIIEAVLVPYSEQESKEYKSLGIAFFGGKIDGYRITPKGKGVLFHYQTSKNRFWIPVIISIIALIFSGIALVAQFLG